MRDGVSADVGQREEGSHGKSAGTWLASRGTQVKFNELKRLRTLDKCTALVTIIGFPLLLISLLFACQLDQRVSDQIEELTTIAQSQKAVADDQLKIAKSQNNIALNQMFYGDPRNVGIIEAIENKKPILKSATGDGQFSNAQFG